MIKNHEVSLIDFIKNQTIAFLTSKMKTFTMTYEPFSTSGGFLTYASFGQKPHFIFFKKKKKKKKNSMSLFKTHIITSTVRCALNSTLKKLKEA